MSTELKSILPAPAEENNVIAATRFFGGTNRGTCIQLTQKNNRTGNFDNIQLTKAQALNAIERLAQFVNDTAEEAEHDPRFE